MKGALRILAALALVAAVAGSFSITGYLARLEAGVLANAEAARALLAAQAAVRDRNAALTDMVEVAGRLGAGLDGVLERSEAIRTHVAAVTAANRAMVPLNMALETDHEAALADLNRVLAALQAMNASAAGIQDHLRMLRETADQDSDALVAIGANTARMNARTPGW